MPDAPDNDPWADLYADLGVTEKPAKSVHAAQEATTHVPADEAEPGDEPAFGESADGDDGAEGDESDDDSDTEAGAPAGPEGDDDGTKKKRRRRRRRGKKKPADGEPVAAGAPAGDADEMPEYGRNAAQDYTPAHAARLEGDIDSEAESDDEEPAEEVGGEAERPLEGATTEMTRELIANWNVPSWEELVTGLHRPNH